MRLIKPNWVTHEGSPIFPIFSIDIHPDGKRFATGGQGEDGGRVVIWNMEPVLDEAKEKDSNIQKTLCQIDSHYACVNCVRWNSKGLLASGGDDKLIMIWRLAKIGTSTVFGTTKVNAETWRCATTLRGHAGDILDLAWSSNDVWLASASIDNTIIIWETTTANIVRVLKGHTGFVKGVTWDPIGRYLASQSDDKSLRIWNATDFSEEAIVTEPFEECGGTTHVLRLSWSPDGQYLVSAHAMNGGGPTAQIIDRQGWKTDKDYVGHRKAVTCVRFDSRILEKKVKKDEKTIQFCCVAIGSRDRSLSVWSTCLKRPLVVIDELFVASVLDISWSPSGLCLCACSKDGTVAFIEFTEDELGHPVDAAGQTQVQERLYGKILKGKFLIMEDPSLYADKVREAVSYDKIVPPKPNNEIQPLPNITTQIPKAPINKQIETRTKDGKRRITPMFIPVTSDMIDPESDKKAPGEDGESIIFSSTSQEKSSIVVEKRDEVTGPTIVSIEVDETPGLSEEAKKILNSVEPPKTQKSKKEETSIPPKVAECRKKSDEIFPKLEAKDNVSAMCGQHCLSALYKDDLTLLQLFINHSENEQWFHYLGYRPTALAVTSTIVAVSLEDGSIHTFLTPRGVRAIPPIIPPSPISRLHAAGSQIMVISCSGELRVWEIGANTCKLQISTNAGHLVAPNSALLQCQLFNEMPLLAFSTARAYVYHKEMDTWLLMADSHDPIWRWSQLTSLGKFAGDIKPTGPLAIVQESLSLFIGKPMPNIKLNRDKAECMMAYYELQISASRALKSSDEYGYWLLAYVNFLCIHDINDHRLRIVLDGLLGPSHSSAHLSNWDPKILNNDKHELLQESLKIISNHLNLQRLYAEYKEQLDEVKKLYRENQNDVEK